jgi:hypothetical protein
MRTYPGKRTDRPSGSTRPGAMDTCERLAVENQRLRARLIAIDSLAGHALKANPTDLEETWMRVQQIAASPEGR